MRKKVFIAILALVVLSSMAVVGSTTEFIDRLLESVSGSLTGEAINSKSRDFSFPSTGEQPEVASIQPTPEKVNVKQIEIPEEILWRVILGFPEKFNTLAERARAMGQDETLYTGYFTRQANLSLESAEIFKQTALEYSAELSPVEDRVQSIGSYRKIARDKGQNISKEESYLLRLELSTLQERQNEIVLKYREKFRSAVDAESFNAFENWLKTNFAASFSSKRTTSRDLKTIPNSNVQNNGFERMERPKQEENQK